MEELGAVHPGGAQPLHLLEDAHRVEVGEPPEVPAADEEVVVGVGVRFGEVGCHGLGLLGDRDERVGQAGELVGELLVAVELSAERQQARREEEELHVERPGLRLRHERDVDGLRYGGVGVAGEPDGRDAPRLAVLDRTQAVVGRARDRGEHGDGVAAERGVARFEELGGDHAAHRQRGAAAGEVLVGPHRGVGAAGTDEEEVGEPLGVQAVDDLLDLRAQGDGAGGLRAECRLVEAEQVVASMVVLSKRVTGPDRFWYRYQVASC